MSSNRERLRRHETSSARQKSIKSAGQTMITLQNDKKEMAQGFLHQCIKIWNKEKRNKNKSYTLRIFNFTSKSTKVKLIRSEEGNNGKKQSTCFPPVANLLYQEYQAEKIDDHHLDYKQQYFSNNAFRVKLPKHQKFKSISQKWTSNSQAKEPSLNFTTSSPFGSIVEKVDQSSKRNQKISQLYKVKVTKRQIKTIQVSPQKVQTDFILSPW